jgi:hypothetical protein
MELHSYMTRTGSDLKLISCFVAFAAFGCAPSDTESDADIARDGAIDASATADGKRRDDALDANSANDDAPRGLVVLPAQFTEENMPMRMLGEGDPLELWPAPQGGHVVLVGAKVKNLVGDSVLLRVRARYPGTSFLIAEEARAVKMLPVVGEPDTMQPDLRTRTQVAHVPLCPDYDPTDIVDRPLEFTVQVTSFGSEEPQAGTATVHLYPACTAGKVDVPFCRCECSANYVLGKCARDAGSD